MSAQASLLEQASAEFSPCRRYRYSLTRTWDEARAPAMFVGLNPSTADETEDDPTIRRCIRFAKDWGCGGLLMGNLYALRSTDPRGLCGESFPVEHAPGENDGHLLGMAERASITVAAWGSTSHPFPERPGLVLAAVGRMHALGVTKDGHPRHPLYMRADARPWVWAQVGGVR